MPGIPPTVLRNSYSRSRSSTSPREHVKTLVKATADGHGLGESVTFRDKVYWTTTAGTSRRETIHLLRPHHRGVRNGGNHRSRTAGGHSSGTCLWGRGRLHPHHRWVAAAWTSSRQRYQPEDRVAWEPMATAYRLADRQDHDRLLGARTCPLRSRSTSLPTIRGTYGPPLIVAGHFVIDGDAVLDMATKAYAPSRSARGRPATAADLC